MRDIDSATSLPCCFNPLMAQLVLSALEAAPWVAYSTPTMQGMMIYDQETWS